MPGPAGQEEYVFAGDRGPTIEKPAEYPFGSKMATGAASGGLSGGWLGAAIGAGVGLIGDTVSYFVNKRATERANARAEKAAASAFYREQASQREAAEWNSEAAQVSRMKAAGLSPALLYNQMGPSTMGAASGSAANIQQQSSADFDASGAYNSYLKSKEIDNLASLQRSQSALNEVEVLKTQIDNMTLHQRNIADMELQLSQMDKNSAEAQKLRQLLDLEKEQLTESINNISASTKKIGAETEFISGAQSNLVKSQTDLTNAQIKTEGERPYEIRQNIETSGDLAVYYRRQSSLFAQEFGIRQSKVDAIASYLDDNGYSRDYLGFALNFCEDMSQHVGSDLSKQSISTIFSWLNGDSWLRYIGSRKNTADIITNRLNISENQIQSNERIASGHDATRLESIDSYFEHAARSHDVETRKEFNKYRSEYHLLNKANKKRIDELSAYYESKGYDADRIAQELGYLTHQLYLLQNAK